LSAVVVVVEHQMPEILVTLVVVVAVMLKLVPQHFPLPLILSQSALAVLLVGIQMGEIHLLILLLATVVVQDLQEPLSQRWQIRAALVAAVEQVNLGRLLVAEQMLLMVRRVVHLMRVAVVVAQEQQLPVLMAVMDILALSAVHLLYMVAVVVEQATQQLPVLVERVEAARVVQAVREQQEQLTLVAVAVAAVI
tara:strand:- start:97 stop:678 length:582 start_codon:yes stop_codon:yes gene_type:complete